MLNKNILFRIVDLATGGAEISNQISILALCLTPNLLIGSPAR